MFNQTKRVLALFLSVMLILSIVPTSLFVSAIVSNDNVTVLDVTDETTLSNLSVSASVPTTLKTQGDYDVFSGRTSANLLKMAIEFEIYSNAAMNNIMTQTKNSNSSSVNVIDNITTQINNMSDGLIATSSNEGLRLGANHGALDLPAPAYMVISLASLHNISGFLHFFG